MKKNNRRRNFFANKIHKDIFIIVSLASIIPATITTIAMYYLVFNITAAQIGIPEAIAYNLIPAAQKVLIILLISTPICIGILLNIAYKISHKAVGPFDRIIRELDARIKGTQKGPITVRKGDKFQPLVNKINKLLTKQ